MNFIDINCDVGEGFENEAVILPYISSCNIACGGHAGNLTIIDETIKIAIANAVKVGAHPSYPDKENFGRKVIEISHRELKNSLTNQINLIKERLEAHHQKLHHIKPHGALYNEVAKNEELATILVDIVKGYSDIFLYVPYDSVIEKLALKNNIKVKYEAFADRNYNNDLSLVSRGHHNAMIEDVNQVAAHLQLMINEHKVKTITNNKISIQADTYCFHTDTPDAALFIQRVISALEKHQIFVSK